MNVIFLASGGGGNFKFLYNYFKNSNKVFFTGLIADRPCGAYDYAISNNIPAKILSFKRDKLSDQVLAKEIKSFQADVIITNVHKILSKRIVHEFTGQLINLHYSILPAFKGLIGMAPVDEAIQLNNVFLGATCHYVNEQVDDGKSIVQSIFCRLLIEDSYQTTFEAGALALLSALLILNEVPEIPISSFNQITTSPSANTIDFEKCKIIFSWLKANI